MSYVKKVVFPLEILPVVSLLSALFHFVIAMVVWVMFYTVFFGIPTAKLIVVPVVILPLLLVTLGLSYFLASMGVYLRDVAQVVGVFITMLMFLSPIFYPVSALPQAFQFFMNINPITFAVEETRGLLVHNASVHWFAWFLHLLAGVGVLMLGKAWFDKTKGGFADVL
ncbi:hypothetical protein GCM10007350_31140 [Jeongeupia chitinilytica]|uniref:Transport permease protein n=1 Tax=Jeongeupia chitinilytica TaxID=1041641 RepID=A0ABQ3H4X2_9NEIS|nr:hypothetical protein GCM10007350_31140 [Jeongeupia chitinilytica]